MTLTQYKKAIEESNIVSKTDIDGVITFVNDEFCKISEYSKEELIGQPHSIVRHPDVPAEVFKRLWDTILAKKTYKATVKNLSKTGKTFYVNTTVIPILDKNGEIEEFIAVRYDVTRNIELTNELKKKEEELERLNATLEHRVQKQTKQLIKLNRDLEKRVQEEVAKNREKDRFLLQQSRLAAMGEMIGNIAHQWRQPLSELGITIYKMKKIFLESGIKREKDFMDSYEHSKMVIKKMSNTIEDFRNFFNPNLEKKTFMVSDAINETLRMMEGTIHRHGLQIEVNCIKKAQINGYLSQFSQVLVNLINNSKDAYKLKGIENKKIDITVDVQTKGYVSVLFEDYAGGINPAVMDKIFYPYFTTKHSSSGTGLGLYMSKMIIENSMNGTISVINSKDGAVFRIVMPSKKIG